MSILRAFAATLGYIWRALDSIRKVLHLLLMLLFFGVLLSAIPGTMPSVPQDAALVIRPFGFLVEEVAGDPFERTQSELLGRAVPQTLVQDVVDALEFAADDDRISMVHLDLSGLAGGGLSKLQRLGSAMQAFRESGKRIVASADFMVQQGYYLAAHADEVHIHPDGLLFLQGYGSYRTYFKDAIDKLRIDWNIFRVGTHKSAVEPYIRMNMSDEDRASRTHLTDTLWRLYREDVIAARELPEGAVARFADELVAHAKRNDGDLAAAAVEQGLVDGLKTRVELRELIIESIGEDPDKPGHFLAVDMGEYLEVMRMLDGDRSGKRNVAVVVASGEFLLGEQAPGTIGSESTTALLREALDDESVEAVVLRIDSPGGATFTSEVIADEILALQQAGKPVVASMGSVAASAGYFIAAGADRILARPSTITGSIGIFGMIPTYQRSLEALGVANDGVGSTIWAGQLRPDRELSDATRELVQMVVEDGYDDFVTHVANYRGMDKDAVDRIGQGQVWLGVDAIENGLIDEFGDIDDAIEVAAELAEMEEGEYGIKTIRQKLSPMQQLLLDVLATAKSFGADLGKFAAPATAVERLAERFEGLVSDFDRFNDPRGVYSHCFCKIE